MSNDETLKRLIEEFRNGDKTAIVKIFNSIRGALNLGTYYDPSHAREFEDFEQVALTAVWEAARSFNCDKGSTSTSWVLTIVKQRLSREVRRIMREHTDQELHYHDIQNDINSDEDLDSMIYSQVQDLEPYTGTRPEFDEGEYYAYVEEVEFRLSRISPRLVKVFYIKLIWPGIDRRSLAAMLGISRMSISKYFKLMRSIMESVYERHSRNRIN